MISGTLRLYFLQVLCSQLLFIFEEAGSLFLLCILVGWKGDGDHFNGKISLALWFFVCLFLACSSQTLCSEGPEPGSARFLCVSIRRHLCLAVPSGRTVAELLALCQALIRSDAYVQGRWSFQIRPLGAGRMFDCNSSRLPLGHVWKHGFAIACEPAELLTSCACWMRSSRWLSTCSLAAQARAGRLLLY